ncbi:hypothetical protein MCP1_20190 [Candidatus Terasakiella magnetica]|nr:hypothetical protein MCP1_20190 [Candidatus Terasakiella magnetica]
MVNSINSSGYGAISLLQGLGGSDNGLYDAISGNVQSNGTEALFSALAGNGSATPKTTEGILQEQRITQARNGIYTNAGQRLAYIKAGTYQPKAEWEKVAGYLMAKGQPVVVTLDSAGQVQAQAQAEADLSKYNVQQQAVLLRAIDDVQTMAQKIKANQTNDKWLKKLAGAADDLTAVATFLLPPQAKTENNWEASGVQMLNAHRPFKISLDAKGQLQAIDQTQDPMTDLPYSMQTKLRAAVEGLPAAIEATDVSEKYKADAMVFDKAKTPFYLEIDKTTGIISAKANTAANITPKFLKTAPYPNVGDKGPLMQKAAEMIKAGAAYFLDIDTTGSVVAKEATPPNIITLNSPSHNHASLQTGAVLSLFA